jgi:type IV pilus assembly protein PilO
MDIDFKDPKFLRWAGAILLIAVIVPTYFKSTLYGFTHASRQKTVTRLEARHNSLSRDLEKARLLVRNLERVEQEYEILHEQWLVAQTLLPEENEMPNLLRKVTAAGEQSGVEFDLFRPQAAVPRGFYADNSVEVTVMGGYHQTGVFLSRLANLNRIVNVSNLSLKGAPNQDEVPYSVETSLTLTAYTLGGGPAGMSADGHGQQLVTSGDEQQPSTASQ